MIDVARRSLIGRSDMSGLKLSSQFHGSQRVATRAARNATHAVFNSGCSIEQIENMTVGWIHHSQKNPDAACQSQEQRPITITHQPRATPRSVFDGSQTDLRHADVGQLVAPPIPSASYRPRYGMEHWLRHLTLGSLSFATSDQYFRDLGIDLSSHAHNLLHLREAHPRMWTAVCRTRLGTLASAAIDHDSTVFNAIVRDHLIVLGALRARMLAEFLRRLATEPMGPSGEDEPLWPLCGRLLVDRIVSPAKSVDKLLRMSIGKETRASEAIWKTIATGQFHYDPRLLATARRVYNRCAPVFDNQHGLANLLAATCAKLGPVCTLSLTDIRESGLGRLSFAQQRLGLSVPQAVTVLAMNLVVLPGHIKGALEAKRARVRFKEVSPVPPALPGSSGRVRRIATVLKMISGCDRHQGDMSTDPDNKAGRKLYVETRALIDRAPAPPGLCDLQILPGVWLQ